MDIRLAQAGLNEWGGTHGGEAGNQLRTKGKLDGELNIVNWYSKPWEYVLRPKDPKKAEIIANTAYNCVRNANIGYDQSQRQTLYWEMKGNGWDASKVKPCETDCSSLWCVCANAAGIPIDPVVYTGTMVEFAKNSGEFEIITKNVNNPLYLQKGDCVLKPYSHCAIVLDNGGDYIATYDVWIRESPVDGKTLKVIPAGALVQSTPYPWVRVEYDGVKGWSSLKYLREVDAK